MLQKGKIQKVTRVNDQFLTTSVPEISIILANFGHSLFLVRGPLPGAWVAELLGVQDRKKIENSMTNKVVIGTEVVKQSVSCFKEGRGKQARDKLKKPQLNYYLPSAFTSKWKVCTY